RGEDQDAAGAVIAPQLAQDVEAVDAGQADVQDDEIVVLLGAGAQRELSGRGVIDRVTRLLQRARQPVGQRLVILDDQNPHAGPLLNGIGLEDITRCGSILPGALHTITDLERKKRGDGFRPHATEEERDYEPDSTPGGLQKPERILTDS